MGLLPYQQRQEKLRKALGLKRLHRSRSHRCFAVVTAKRSSVRLRTGRGNRSNAQILLAEEDILRRSYWDD